MTGNNFKISLINEIPEIILMYQSYLAIRILLKVYTMYINPSHCMYS